MTALFADTAFFIAYLNRRDAHYQLAADYMQQAACRFVTTQWVLCELANFFSSSSSRPTVASFIRDLSGEPRFDVVGATSANFDAGLSLYMSRQDKHWSLTDCISVGVSQRRKIRQILTTDHHFEQAGFEILLKRSIKK